MNENAIAAAVALSVGMPFFMYFFHKPSLVLPYLVVWCVVVIWFIRELLYEERP